MTVVAEVKPTDHRRIPSRLDVPHAVAFFFHDELGRLVAELERVRALTVRVDLEPDETKDLEGLSGDALWEWLKSSGRQDVIDDLTYRQLTAAVVADAAHFLCESLLASGKGKTAVAFSLLRKPLKENLLLLEWLLVSPKTFLASFHGESSKAYVLNHLPLAQRRSILRGASRIVAMEGVDDELLWVIRYAKEYPNSLETLWTKATHLVTTVNASATEPGNLNFVFSSQVAVEEQWEHYYRIVPLLLCYFLKVAERVALRFVEVDERAMARKTLQRNLALMRYAEYMDEKHVGAVGGGALWSRLEDLEFLCEDCGAAVTLHAENRDRLWVLAELKCDTCSRVYGLWEELADQTPGVTGT